MALVTLQVVEGLERGRTFGDLITPVTIGREEDNAIRLNDERVSRFHAKIQDDGGCMILTDLESTNGTRINGHPVQMRVLRPGDRLTIGRSVLLFGSREEIAAWAEHLAHRSRSEGSSSDMTLSDQGEEEDGRGGSHPPAIAAGPAVADEPLDLFPEGAPELPQELRAVQRAQLSDLLTFMHDRLSKLLTASVVESEPMHTSSDEMPLVRIDWINWQRLQALQMELAAYLRRLGDPEH